MAEYEEHIADILITLKDSKNYGISVPVSFWQQKYDQDVTFLVKELGNARARGRSLTEVIRQTIQNLTSILQSPKVK